MGLFGVIILVTALYTSFAADDNICFPQSFGEDSFVCVCDEEHCDYIFKTIHPDEGYYVRYVSSQNSARFDIIQGVEEGTPIGNTTLIIDHHVHYQHLLGFGSTFTDSTGMNILAMGEVLQEKIMRSYFGDDGIDYHLGRIPIAGTDNSIRPYSYDDVAGDVDLQYFELQEEDLMYKIPLIQMAIELASHNISLFGSPWAPPAWMKENGMVNGTGGLLPEMQDPYSQYLVKFVQEYERFNMTLWGITPQNEPMNGFEDWPWNTCAFSAEDMRDFIKNSFGPIFEEAGLDRLQVMILDDNREFLPDYPSVILNDTEASSYVDGIAVHWYTDNDYPASLLNDTQDMFPDKFLLYTEASSGVLADPSEKVLLGSWQRAENYAANIIEDMNNYVQGWVDKNMALDLTGGPSWANSYLDAPIIADPENGVFYRQPMYYALGHFSKFLREGSERLNTIIEGNDDVIKAVSFHDHRGTDVVVVLNTDTSPQDISILAHSGEYINIRMEAKSIETILFE